MNDFRRSGGPTAKWEYIGWLRTDIRNGVFSLLLHLYYSKRWFETFLIYSQSSKARWNWEAKKKEESSEKEEKTLESRTGQTQKSSTQSRRLKKEKSRSSSTFFLMGLSSFIIAEKSIKEYCGKEKKLINSNSRSSKLIC